MYQSLTNSVVLLLGYRFRNSCIIFGRLWPILPLRSDNLLTSLCVKYCQDSGEVFVLEGVYSFLSICRKPAGSNGVPQPAGTVPNLRTPLSSDKDCEVRANAIARADWVILHSVITLITILPPFSLYLHWSLLSGTRLHPGGFICDSLSSPTLPISHSPPSPLLVLLFFSLHLSYSSFPFVCCSVIFVLLYLL